MFHLVTNLSIYLCSVSLNFRMIKKQGLNETVLRLIFAATL